MGNAIACSFAKEGAKGVVLVDIQDEKTFNEGKANVEKYGAKVGTMIPKKFRLIILIAQVHYGPRRCYERRPGRKCSKAGR